MPDNDNRPTDFDLAVRAEVSRQEYFAELESTPLLVQLSDDLWVNPNGGLALCATTPESYGDGTTKTETFVYITTVSFRVKKPIAEVVALLNA